MSLIKGWNTNTAFSQNTGIPTPETGFSEWLQKTFQPQTAYTPAGGSNMFPDQNSTYSNTPINWNAQASYPVTSTTQRSGGGSSAVVQPQVLGTSVNNDSGGTYIDPYAGIKEDISRGYDSYLSELDNVLSNDLPNQFQTQNSIATNSYNTNLSNLDTQKTLGLRDLANEETAIGSRQGKTLRDLSSNMRNMFMSGNTYLGSMGAGDSSAVNQYSHALTKLGTRQRSDVLEQANSQYGQVADRKFKLNELYNSETKNLKSDLDNKLLSVSQWFSQQQQEIRYRKSQGLLQKGQDLASLSKELLNVGLQAIQNARSEYTNRKSMLEQWAVNNASNATQLGNNMNAISAYTAPQLSYGQIAGNPQFTSDGRLYVPAGYGYGNEERKDIFGNRVG